jgi:hypothetical protein
VFTQENRRQRLAVLQYRDFVTGVVLAVFQVSGLLSTHAQTSVLSYNRDVRPILAEYCFACHGMDSAGREADLRLDLRDAAIDSGAFVPNDADESLMIERIFSHDPDAVMPPPETKKALTQAERETLVRWVNEGATYEKHWAFIRPTDVNIKPSVASDSWCKNRIDEFVLAELEKAKLNPAPEADASRFFRRLHLDITGLPPNLDIVKEFQIDYQSDGDAAVSVWIDRLMQSTAWGEHRARAWLDAARYADTHGMHRDNYREIWPYRDWVIRAFNQNLPFDQFVVEQLAGDLLDHPTTDQLVATGFQRCTMTTNEGGTIEDENFAQQAADRVQTFGWVFLGLTTNCCQCHDHKFDPLSMKDYYSMSAYFRNTTQPSMDRDAKDGGGPSVRVPQDSELLKVESLKKDIDHLRSTLTKYQQDSEQAFEKWSRGSYQMSDSAEIGVPVMRASLNEGSGQPWATWGSDPSPSKVNGKITWAKTDDRGSAVKIHADSPLDLGSLGDVELDQPFSFAAWVKTPNPNRAAAIIARMDVANQYRGWDLHLNGGKLAMHLIDSWPENAIKVGTKQSVLKNDQWQHIAVSWDGSRKPSGIKIFIDGELQTTETLASSLQPKASIRTKLPTLLGRRIASEEIFESGLIQDFCFFDATLDRHQAESLRDGRMIETILRRRFDQRTDADTLLLKEHYFRSIDATSSEIIDQLAEAQLKLKESQDSMPTTLIQDERKDQPAMARLLMRGEYDSPGEQVEAATPASLHPMPSDAPRNRLGLARWVIDPENPLTARVTVNRFWQEVFGQGIVTTPEDFGVMGSPPSNQALLDWMALDFVQNGWDVKRLFKQILMSATYRQSAIVTPEKLETDRDNSLLSRGPRFRMDAEMIRDQAIAAGGLLSDRMYGPGVKPYQPENLWNMVGLGGSNTRDYVQDEGESLYRRSIYTFWKRMSPLPSLEAFNAPNREICTVRRERTNTPLQALVTLNDPQFVEAARVLAQQSMKERSMKEQSPATRDSSTTDERLLQSIANRILCRDLTKDELDSLRPIFESLRSHYRDDEPAAKSLIAIGQWPVDTEISEDPDRVTELAAATVMASQLMNLDEVLSK